MGPLLLLTTSCPENLGEPGKKSAPCLEQHFQTGTMNNTFLPLLYMCCSGCMQMDTLGRLCKACMRFIATHEAKGLLIQEASGDEAQHNLIQS